MQTSFGVEPLWSLGHLGDMGTGAAACEVVETGQPFDQLLSPRFGLISFLQSAHGGDSCHWSDQVLSHPLYIRKGAESNQYK
jgi:hypothetical protein